MSEQTNVQDRGASAPAGSRTDSTKEKVKDRAAELAADARDKGSELVDEGKDKAQELGERAGEVARTRAAQEKERIATGIRTFADVLRRGSDDLSPDRNQYRPILTSAADRVEEISSYLESRDVDGLTRDVRRFARDHTPLFLGGAFVLGFAGARFLKSSGDAARREAAGRGDYDLDRRHERMLPESERFGERVTPPAYGDSGSGGVR